MSQTSHPRSLSSRYSDCNENISNFDTEAKVSSEKSSSQEFSVDSKNEEVVLAHTIPEENKSCGAVCTIEANADQDESKTSESKIEEVKVNNDCITEIKSTDDEISGENAESDKSVKDLIENEENNIEQQPQTETSKVEMDILPCQEENLEDGSKESDKVQNDCQNDQGDVLIKQEGTKIENKETSLGLNEGEVVTLTTIAEETEENSNLNHVNMKPMEIVNEELDLLCEKQHSNDNATEKEEDKAIKKEIEAIDTSNVLIKQEEIKVIEENIPKPAEQQTSLKELSRPSTPVMSNLVNTVSGTESKNDQTNSKEPSAKDCISTKYSVKRKFSEVATPDRTLDSESRKSKKAVTAYKHKDEESGNGTKPFLTGIKKKCDTQLPITLTSAKKDKHRSGVIVFDMRKSTSNPTNVLVPSNKTNIIHSTTAEKEKFQSGSKGLTEKNDDDKLHCVKCNEPCTENFKNFKCSHLIHNKCFREIKIFERSLCPKCKTNTLNKGDELPKSLVPQNLFKSNLTSKENKENL